MIIYVELCNVTQRIFEYLVLYDQSRTDGGFLIKARMEMSDRLYPLTCTKPTFATFPAANSSTERAFEAQGKIHIHLLPSVWPLLVNVLQEQQIICNKTETNCSLNFHCRNM
jgi:hypothetical protein